MKEEIASELRDIKRTIEREVANREREQRYAVQKREFEKLKAIVNELVDYVYSQKELK